MKAASLKEQFINVIEFHYERELWAFRPEETYEGGIESFVDDLVRIARYHKNGLKVKPYNANESPIDSTSMDYIIGKKIQDLRIQKGWTLSRLAKKIRMDANYLLSIERGELLIRIWDLQEVARALNINTAYFLTF